VLFIFSIRKSCGGWLIDNTLYIKTSDFTSVDSSLSLIIVKVCGNGNYCFSNGRAKEFFRIFLKFGEYFCPNFFGSYIFPIEFN
jgi:hypothetical protein